MKPHFPDYCSFCDDSDDFVRKEKQKIGEKKYSDLDQIALMPLVILMILMTLMTLMTLMSLMSLMSLKSLMTLMTFFEILENH